jgi:hypothetical protein
MFRLDDGSPFPTDIQNDAGDTREATYGEDDTDDCPGWSDYDCSATGGQRRRWFMENDLSPRSEGTSLTRVRKQMPKGLRRGGHRVMPKLSD